MTYSMELIIEINKHTPFKTMKCNYTAQGIEATLVDARDGQVYKVEVKPTGETLCPEGINDVVNYQEEMICED